MHIQLFIFYIEKLAVRILNPSSSSSSSSTLFFIALHNARSFVGFNIFFCLLFILKLTQTLQVAYALFSSVQSAFNMSSLHRNFHDVFPRYVPQNYLLVRLYKNTLFVFNFSKTSYVNAIISSLLRNIISLLHLRRNCPAQFSYVFLASTACKF